jgi:hypothetical protein
MNHTCNICSEPLTNVEEAWHTEQYSADSDYARCTGCCDEYEQNAIRNWLLAQAAR